MIPFSLHSQGIGLHRIMAYASRAFEGYLMCTHLYHLPSLGTTVRNIQDHPSLSGPRREHCGETLSIRNTGDPKWVSQSVTKPSCSTLIPSHPPGGTLMQWEYLCEYCQIFLSELQYEGFHIHYSTPHWTNMKLSMAFS